MILTRPRSIEEMIERDQNFVTQESFERGLSYQPDPTDIFISPYSKCGTTWMQQIVHGLRTSGSMAFDEITEVVPWLELAHDMGWDVAAPQVDTPKAFKSHLRWDEIPKGGRYINVVRDPEDAMISLFKFLEGWRFEAGCVSIEAFADYYLARPDSDGYWGHITSWWRQRDNPDVLTLSFEGMKADLPGTVDAVADFMGLGPDPALRELAARQASFDFMKAHNRQFDDHLQRACRDAACGLPPDGVATKVSTGNVGAGKPVLSDEIRARMDAKWQDTMGAEFGLRSYQDLLEALNSTR